MGARLGIKAAILSVALLIVLLTGWQLATGGSGPAANVDPEYAKLMGATAVIRLPVF
jgi:nitrate/nitrite transport system permease protein